MTKPVAKAKLAAKKKAAAAGKKAPAAKKKVPASAASASASASTSAAGKEPVLLSGGNPQIARGEGDGPLQAYIAAMPGWKREIGRRLDALIVRTVPGVPTERPPTTPS